MNAGKLANYTDVKAQELWKTLYLCAKENSSRRFHALYDKIWDGNEGFDFRGFHHRKYPKPVKGGKKVYVMAYIPSQKAMKKMRERIKRYTEPRNKLYLQLEEMVKGLNRILQGFKNYYSVSSIGQRWLCKIDWYVLERLNLFWNKKRNVRKKHGRIKELIKKTTYILVKVGS